MATWTDANFEEMSWHDNYIHGLQFVEGEYGAGELILDLDYILEWTRSDSGRFQFKIAPATLTFREVTNLKLNIDYQSISAAMGPFSIAGITQTHEKRERYTARIWKIELNFPVGQLVFESSGFEQNLWGRTVLADQQVLAVAERKRIE
jgi:hypothetical protein